MAINSSLHRQSVADVALEHLALDEAGLRARVLELEADNLTLREIAHEALAVVVQRDRTIRHLRDDKRFLTAQLRAAVSGRTIAAERQDMDREALDAENGHEVEEADDAHRRAT